MKKNRKNRILTFLGVAVFMFTVIANVQYSLNGYNSKNMLKASVLAQTSSSTSTETGTATATSTATSWRFPGNGSTYNNTATHYFGSDWYPSYTKCTKSLGIEPYVQHEEGHSVRCINGNGNCYYSTLCYAGA